MTVPHQRALIALAPTPKVLVFAALLAALALTPQLAAQNSSVEQDVVARARQLAEAEKWRELLAQFPESRDAPAELDFYRGLALAHTGELHQARRALRRGAAKAPRDKRFPIETAGVAYQQKQFGAAKSELHRALHIDPADEYAINLLASIYFLEGNLEAALKYWNRIAKPRLADLTFDPQPRLQPALLDRAFQFSYGQPFRVGDYLHARAKVEHLGVFARPQFALNAREDETYDLTFRALERNGWGNGALETALGLLRELPYQGVRAEIYNINGGAMNWKSHLRWDAQKRRIASELATPLGENPARSVRLYFDARNENWDFARALLVPATAEVNARRVEGGAEIRSVINGRWKWSSGIAYSWRRYRNPMGIPPAATAYFENGSTIRYAGRVERALLHAPERRFTIDAVGGGEFGKHFATSLGGYARLHGALRLRWLPRARGDDDEVESRLRGGRAFGGLLFDELAMLGVERDNDLWLRGHAGARDRKKGSAPLGADYMLWNVDYLRKIYGGGFFTLRAGPFVDAGRITEPKNIFGARTWQWDTGVQARMRVLGSVEVTLGYGRDLRNARNTFFTAVTR